VAVPDGTDPLTWFTPQARLTAVGRASRILSISVSSLAASQLSSAAWTIARATPRAPTGPRAGAPRIASRLIESTRTSTVVTWMYCSVPGNRVWSMSLIIGLGSSTHSIDRTIEPV